MVLFGTQEWLDEYRRRINESVAYRAAAATWEGTVAYLFEGDDGEPAGSGQASGLGAGRTRCVLMDLARGECRRAWESVREEADRAPLVIRAPYHWWRQILRGELDPIKGMMQGKLRLRGDVPTIVRYVRASNELVHIATQIPTEFPEE